MSNPTKKKLIIKDSSNESESKTDESKSSELEESTSSISKNTVSSDKGPLDYDLKTQFEKLGEGACEDENYYSSECNKFLLKKEVIEGDYLSKNPYLDVDLYPNLSDTNFNIKIATSAIKLKNTVKLRNKYKVLGFSNKEDNKYNIIN